MIIVKIGGGDRLNLDSIAKDLANLEPPYLVVHGANALRDEIAARMGFTRQELTSASGYTSVFSDHEMLDAIMMAYSGVRNKRLVELLQRNGINALGLTGLDGRLVQGRRNPGIRVIENGRKMIKRDLSGKPVAINTQLLGALLDHDLVPVITIPLCDENGFAINSENDDVVAALQAATEAHTVIQLIEAPGLMADVNQPDSLIRTLSREDLSARLEASEGRIKRKLHALNKVVGSGKCKVIIADGRGEHPITDALAHRGTVIGSDQ